MVTNHIHSTLYFFLIYYLFGVSVTLVQSISSSSTSPVPQVVTQDGQIINGFVEVVFSRVIFVDHVLFVQPFRSRLHCAVACALDPACMAFTLTSEECRGHCSRVSGGESSALAHPGAQTYERPAPDSTVAEFNLAAGTASSPLPEGVTYFLNLTSPNDTCSCSSQGMVALNFLPGVRSVAHITLTLRDPVGIPFILSAQPSDGFGGSAGACNSEIHLADKRLLAYLSPNRTRKEYLGYYVKGGPHRVIAVDIASYYVTVDNGATRMVLDGEAAFCVNTASNTTTNNNNNLVYFGLNRVGVFTNTTRRTGFGLCRATLQFHP